VSQATGRAQAADEVDSFALFFVIVFLWCIELHCLIQIIISRLTLLIYSERKKFWLKWAAFAYVSLLNVSVFIIWIPAQLQYDPYHEINLIWDRVEKALYLILDLCLNLYFTHLVKTKMISSGVTNYWSLYKFNVWKIVISLSMDILIIALMSLSNALLYMQSHPVAYMIKLNIEMSMAHLIGKIARSQAGGMSYSDPTHSTGRKGGAIHLSETRKSKDRHSKKIDLTMTSRLDEADLKDDARYQAWVSTGAPASREGKIEQARGDGSRSPGLSMVDEETNPQHGFIAKDTSVYITPEPVADECAPSESSSTRKLRP
jgi:hypothetical protein